MNEDRIKKELEKEYPTARKGFIDILVDSLSLHAKKNHDYNPAKEIDPADHRFELLYKFADIRRKYTRLYNAVVEKKEMKVDESLLDTVTDLGVYAFLMAEYIKNKK